MLGEGYRGTGDHRNANDDMPPRFKDARERQKVQTDDGFNDCRYEVSPAEPGYKSYPDEDRDELEAIDDAKGTTDAIWSGTLPPA